MNKHVANLIWRVAGISPRWGNRVMDILGDELYCEVMKSQSLTSRR